MARQWTDFPAPYADLVHRFATQGSVFLPMMSKREAITARVTLYRFRDAINHAIKTELSEETAEELADLSDAFANLTTELEHVGGESWRLVMKKNPVFILDGKDLSQTAPPTLEERVKIIEDRLAKVESHLAFIGKDS